MHSRNIRATGILAILTALLTPPALSGNDAEIAALRQQIAELDQKLRVLERRAELAQEAQEAARARQPVVSVGPGLSFTSADKKYSFRVRANVHIDGRFYINDGGIPNNDGFLLRRIRPTLEGTVGQNIKFRLTPDFAPDTPTLMDAYVDYSVTDTFGFIAGRQKSPLSLERLQSALLFVERAYPSTLLTNREIGFYLRGSAWDKRLDWTVGIQKGAPDGASATTSSLRDDDPEVVARVFAHPFAKDENSALKGLGIGFAIARDRAENVAPSNYRTLAQQTFFSWGSGSTVDGEVLRWSPQAYWYNGPFGLFAEYASSSQEIRRGVNFARITNVGWQLAGNWVLTGEKASYNAITPAFPLDPAAGNWGAWEVAARVSGLKIDDDAFPLFADPSTSASEVLTTTLGVNWYPNRHLKLILNYETTGFTGGALGTVTRQREHAIFTRVQFTF